MEHPKGKPMVVPANEGRKMFVLGPDTARVKEIFNRYDIEILEASSEYAKTG